VSILNDEVVALGLLYAIRSVKELHLNNDITYELNSKIVVDIFNSINLTLVLSYQSKSNVDAH